MEHQRSNTGLKTNSECFSAEFSFVGTLKSEFMVFLEQKNVGKYFFIKNSKKSWLPVFKL